MTLLIEDSICSSSDFLEGVLMSKKGKKPVRPLSIEELAQLAGITPEELRAKLGTCATIDFGKVADKDAGNQGGKKYKV